MRDKGNERLLRQTYVESAGHCDFTPGEQVAAIGTMVDRLRTGRWPGTGSRAMNARAAAADPGGAAARYLPFRPPRFNRPFYG
ncbi:hypothetical protein ODJ79_09685 [Actinoplanes sp. KI2]|uniref:hypothetical protein n=1 Tax=Actinoplanes sp. KI2 TaxID=2983315 RepID=UPI0021D5B5B6|nr:hypothetical protein [Actinoplanes sp. KI2]MCU7723986.1 hypothetical protein [Actinoplanes sp. KI2]